LKQGERHKQQQEENQMFLDVFVLDVRQLMSNHEVQLRPVQILAEIVGEHDTSPGRGCAGQSSRSGRDNVDPLDRRAHGFRQLESANVQFPGFHPAPVQALGGEQARRPQ